MDYDRLDPALRRFRELYRDDSPAWLERPGELCAPDFELHDPFGSLRGDLRFGAGGKVVPLLGSALRAVKKRL